MSFHLLKTVCYAEENREDIKFRTAAFFLLSRCCAAGTSQSSQWLNYKYKPIQQVTWGTGVPFIAIDCFVALWSNGSWKSPMVIFCSASRFHSHPGPALPFLLFCFFTCATAPAQSDYLPSQKKVKSWTILLHVSCDTQPVKWEAVLISSCCTLWQQLDSPQYHNWVRTLAVGVCFAGPPSVTDAQSRCCIWWSQ